MNEATPWARTARIMGWLMLAVGISVFAIRLQHAGPYELPEQGNLRAGLFALAIGVALLLTPRARSAGGGSSIPTLLLLIISPVVLFFALYATLAELEEVVVLRATDSSGAPSNLRLWIVDAEGAAWVSMSTGKLEEHSLDGAQLDLLRAGETTCVVATLSSDPAENERTFRLRDEKYSVQRLGRMIGMFGDGPGPDTVTLRLDPCP
ncbi:MAG: hypothetical protein JRG83_07140 [Deltaproteobacteria bacterium]|nr:hypothetical protein [Deltaproteobacteria bacterium]